MTENVEAAEAAETVVIEIEQICDMPNPDPDNTGYIAVDAKKNKKSARIYYNFGADMADMVDKFGEELVYGFAKAQMKIKLQSVMRSYLEASRDPLELAEKFHPGVAMERLPVDMNKATENYFKELSDEEQDAMIEKLMEAKGS